MEVFTAVLYIVLFAVVYKIIDYLMRLPHLSAKSRYILVTGCDTGIGHAVARQLDSLGSHVIAACYTEAGETELCKHCSSRLTTVHLDVTSHDSVLKAYQKVKDLLPHGKGIFEITSYFKMGFYWL